MPVVAEGVRQLNGGLRVPDGRAHPMTTRNYVHDQCLSPAARRQVPNRDHRTQEGSVIVASGAVFEFGISKACLARTVRVELSRSRGLTGIPREAYVGRPVRAQSRAVWRAGEVLN